MGGKDVFKNIEYDVFEYAQSKVFVNKMNRNAYREFDIILKEALEVPKNNVLLFILGPCSKALVYELSKQGRMAWDIGHLAKDYDWYRKDIKVSEKNIVKFFSPD